MSVTRGSSVQKNTPRRPGNLPTKLKWTLQALNFIDLLAVGFIEPLITPLAKKHGALPVVASAIGSMYGLFQLLSSAPFGYLSDKLGRKFVYIFSCVGTAFAYSLLGMNSYMCIPLLFASRSIAGISKHSGEAINALIVDYTVVEKRSIAFGRMQTASTLGMMIAPTIGGFLYHWAGEQSFLPASISCSLLFIDCVLAWYLLPSNEEVQKRRVEMDSSEQKKEQKVDCDEGFSLLRPGVLGALALRLLMGLALVMFRQSLALVLTYRFSMAPELLGMVFSYQGLVYSLCYYLLIPALSKWKDDSTLTTLGFMGMAVGCLAAALAPTVGVFCITVAPVVAAAAVARTSSTTTLTHLVPPHQAGRMLGLADIVFSVSRMGAPAISGILMQHLGDSAPLFCCATAAGVAALVSANLVHKPHIKME
eukprot:CAMPEP_0196600318 /NCGR_PEP_ID=MMETSP1081-20130531/95326_1 /TAXON_ID=36882 /ORGANISM="Pyramimonas amylifera, Strain CCMP720" /LENGTH=421 /DNA_ID=CAMNT_0041926149 /DNA_START=607 /DNA_END=1872 /DNA_ORIENTATION=-